MNETLDVSDDVRAKCCSIAGSAAEFKTLDGTYAITGGSLIDPPSDEKEDRVVFIVEGRAAKDIYNGIQASPQKSACDSKVYLKIAQNLACTKDGKLYRCTVAVLLKSVETASSLVC